LVVAGGDSGDSAVFDRILASPLDSRGGDTARGGDSDHRFLKDHLAAHGATSHGKGQYVNLEDRSIHSNTVEGYFSTFKRGMKRVHQFFGKQHLHRYLAEFEFRYNNRVAHGIGDTERADRLLTGSVGGVSRFKRETERLIDAGELNPTEADEALERILLRKVFSPTAGNKQMSDLTLNRIRRVLHDQFDGHIDMADFSRHPADQIESCFLSRALAAQCIRSLTGADPSAAGAAVVDGFSDCGIDAVHFDAITDTLYLVQSKWSGNEKKPTIDEGDATKFVNGIKALIQPDFERFNDKVKAKAPEIREALFSSRQIDMRIVTVHTAIQPISMHVARVIDELTESLNSPVPIAQHIDYDQAGVYRLITAESRDAKITIQAGLSEWGAIDKPFLAYYGQIQLQQVLQWWNEHRNKLFSQNLRLFYQNSAVNEALRKTIIEDPASFWYFNNGITIIADRVVKGIAGATANKFGNFTCEGASVVNGAQTVGTVGNSLVLQDDDENAWVQVRLISLEKCPPGFGSRITRAANLQNSVGTREFAAMDPLQHRIATEFALDKRRYVYKQGEADPRGDDGCSIVEATQAIGCAISVGLAVQVKKEIGQIWADTESTPYTEIFNDRLGSSQVWRAVLIMRAVDDKLHRLKSSGVPRAEAVSAHMNRVILHLVHSDPKVIERVEAQAVDDDVVNAARTAVEPIYRKVSAYLEKYHENDYLAVFCKNVAKCEDVVKFAQRGHAGIEVQGSLFGN
jgi:hypothetical protein